MTDLEKLAAARQAIRTKYQLAAKGEPAVSAEMPELNKEVFLGDGLYGRFDGHQIWLRADRNGLRHEVAVEPMVWRNLRNWIGSYPLFKRQMDYY